MFYFTNVPPFRSSAEYTRPPVICVHVCGYCPRLDAIIIMLLEGTTVRVSGLEMWLISVMKAEWLRKHQCISYFIRWRERPRWSEYTQHSSSDIIPYLNECRVAFKLLGPHRTLRPCYSIVPLKELREFHCFFRSTMTMFEDELLFINYMWSCRT